MKDITINDRVKRLYQRSFGPGHLVDDPAEARTRVEAECASLTPVSFEEPLFESLGNGYSRMNLRPLSKTGLSLSTASAMFIYSANHSHRDEAGFAATLDALPENDDEREWLDSYKKQGCPAIHHSDAYRAEFQPAYRVVLDVFARAFALIRRIDLLPQGIIAIDGPCAAGKSTLAATLGEIFDAGVLHIDDFFLRPEQRTAARLAEPGGNFDRERFLDEVLTPLRAGQSFTYRPYNCAHQVIGDPVTFQPRPRTIIEGVYCMHPDLRNAYDLSAFLTVDPVTQRARLLKRNGEALLRRFEAEWIPMENRYFEAFGVERLCDVVLGAFSPQTPDQRE